MKPLRVKIATPELRAAFAHGRRSAIRGLKLQDNPYRPESDGDLWRAWNSGFADKGQSKEARIRRNRHAAVVAEHGAICWLCLKPIPDGGLTMDHVIPRSKGGRTTRDNLRPAHVSCNQKRGNGPPPELLLTADMMLGASMSLHPILRKARAQKPCGAIGHMQFEDHRTQREVRLDEEYYEQRTAPSLRRLG